jgi:hypothetical protein
VPTQSFYRLPVVSAGAEYLVMGHLMRRNILTYKAPQNNEGYDLIAIHPEPRHKPRGKQRDRILIQVKSRYQTDSDRGFPVKEASFEAFDYVVVAFLNIGNFMRGRDGTSGETETEFFTLPRSFIRAHHDSSSSWEKVRLRGLENEIAQYKGGLGFEQIARDLGVPRPQRLAALSASTVSIPRKRR